MRIYRTVAVASYRQRIGYQAGLLAGVCMIVAALILIGNLVTGDRIYAMQQQDQRMMLQEVLPNSLYDNDLLGDQLTVALQETEDGESVEDQILYVARLNQQVTGYAFSTVANGYGGPIEMILGVDTEGKVLGVRVINHKETPGLGDKIEISRDSWITSFNGLSLKTTPKEQWAVQKDGGQFDQFTGATITPRAVVRAVYAGLSKVPQLRAAAMKAMQEKTVAKEPPVTETKLAGTDLSDTGSASTVTAAKELNKND